MKDNKYTFCPVCSGKFKNPGAFKQLECSECGFLYYKNSIPTVGVVLYSNNEVLLVKRAIEPQKGKWDLPGGFLENGEGPLDGLQREMGEELGTEVEIDDILGVFVDKYPYDRSNDLHMICFYYVGRVSGDISAGDDVASAKWFNINDIPWEDLAMKNTRDAIEEYIISQSGCAGCEFRDECGK